MFIKYAHLLTGVARDDNVDDAWVFVCSLYGIEEKDAKGTDGASNNLFVKAKRDLEVLSPNHGA